MLLDWGLDLNPISSSPLLWFWSQQFKCRQLKQSKQSTTAHRERGDLIVLLCRYLAPFRLTASTTDWLNETTNTTYRQSDWLEWTSSNLWNLSCCCCCCSSPWCSLSPLLRQKQLWKELFLIRRASEKSWGQKSQCWVNKEASFFFPCMAMASSSLIASL